MSGVVGEQNPRQKKVHELTNREITKEAVEIHAQFKELSERYQQSPPAQRAEIREKMQPLVNRERELRQEFAGRAEVNQDIVPEQQMAFGR